MAANHSAFLVTFHNRMEPHTRCAAIGTLMTFTSVDDNVSVGCIHYMVHLFSSPLNVTFWSVRAVPDLVTVHLFSSPLNVTFWSVRAVPDLVTGCGPDAEDTYTHLAITILDDRSGMVEAIACAVTSVVVIGLLGVVYIWRHRTVQKRKRQSRCLRRMLGMGESDIHEEHDETVALKRFAIDQRTPLGNDRTLERSAGDPDLKLEQISEEREGKPMESNMVRNDRKALLNDPREHGNYSSSNRILF
ncbi:hypothetical protein Tcan_06435 [Toxocara canis]|uniref:Uncharacterized protein n=1 Tax=Toxocara canis TaxID=6265 RepID=A0A0B2VZ82_TOXCA|nr:hypothetical protein Tcan_06435 [Toxocara canis]